MPVANSVLTGPALGAAVLDNFVNTYRTEMPAVEAELSLVMEDISGRSRTDEQGYPESAPYFSHWDYGESISSENFEYITYTYTHRRYGKRISWLEDDRKDEKTRTLLSQAQQLGQNVAWAKREAFFDLLLGTTIFLPATVNAPDGVGFFSATDGGGGDRFGLTGGNIITGDTLGTVQNILTNFYEGKSQFMRFLNTKNKKLIPQTVIDRGVLVIYGAANEEIFQRAFRQTQQVNLAAADAAAPESNILLDTNERVKLMPTELITDDDWFIFLTGTTLKPLGRSVLEALQTDLANRANSDFTRDFGEEYFQAYSRDAYFINLPYMAMQINN